jgi:hypothetical protein
MLFDIFLGFVAGEMVLYESHSVIHGRPFPLKGRFYANIFIHFEPVGHTLRHHNHETDAGGDVDAKYRDALSRGAGGHENADDNNGLPPVSASAMLSQKCVHLPTFAANLFLVTFHHLF